MASIKETIAWQKAIERFPHKENHEVTKMFTDFVSIKKEPTSLMEFSPWNDDFLPTEIRDGSIEYNRRKRGEKKEKNKNKKTEGKD